MGLRIGDTVSTIAAARPPQRNEDSRNVGSQGEENRPPAREAGFGENTTSPLNAALDAIDRTVRRVADIVPSVEDLREDFQDRFQSRLGEGNVETEETAETEPERSALPEPQRVRPEASPQVRNFAEAGIVPREEDGEDRAPAEQTRAGANPTANRLDVLA